MKIVLKLSNESVSSNPTFKEDGKPDRKWPEVKGFDIVGYSGLDSYGGYSVSEYQNNDNFFIVTIDATNITTGVGIGTWRLDAFGKVINGKLDTFNDVRKVLEASTKLFAAEKKKKYSLIPKIKGWDVEKDVDGGSVTYYRTNDKAKDYFAGVFIETDTLFYGEVAEGLITIYDDSGDKQQTIKEQEIKVASFNDIASTLTKADAILKSVSV